MYETIRYEKPFLRQVIARIDFVGAIEVLEKSMPSKLANLISGRFPIAEPADAVAQDIQVDAQAITPQQPRVFKQWNFFSKDREKQLSVAAAFIYVTYSRYTTYEDMVEDFGAIVEGLGRIFPEAKVGRFGLRYINQIEILELPDPVTWNDYLAGDLINTGAFFGDAGHLTRLFHLL